MNNPIFVTRASMPPIEEYMNQIKPLWDSAWLTNMGIIHQQFETELLSYLRVPNLSLLVNGHMALEMTLQALKLSGEVITTPFTFASTTHAIVRNGLTPVFCDINQQNYTIDVNKIEELITEKTTAILPVHIYGQICDVKAIEHIAQKHNLKVVYDAAHSFGVKLNNIGIGTFGDASIFSFHATKVFNSIEGGAVTFTEKQIGDELYKLKNFGILSETEVDGVGANAKMNEFQAAMGVCNLRHVDEEIYKRKCIVERYKDNLDNLMGLRILEEQKNVTTNYAYFPILIDETIFGIDRDTMYNKLKEKNIFTRKYFYPLTSQFQCYEGKFGIENTPIAQYVSERILTLPLYAEMKLDEVDLICNYILDLKK